MLNYQKHGCVDISAGNLKHFKNMRFSIVGEGLSDYIVLKNLLVGFFNDKNLPVTRLLPKDKEPVGWGNVFAYLATEEFRNGVANTNYCIVQIDTKECDEWNERIRNIGDNAALINDFITAVIAVLKSKIGSIDESQKQKIIFAVSVHEIECWLLPFNSDKQAQSKKLAGCSNAIEFIANKKGFSIHQKFYQEGKNYDTLSKEMKDNKSLMGKATQNPSLAIFVDTLSNIFPACKSESE